MNKTFIITYYIQGEFYKQSTSKNNFDWEWADHVEDEIKKMYPDYKEISSSTEGYSVLFNEKQKKSICYHYKKIEYTGLQDANGSAIAVGDKLVLKEHSKSEDEIKDNMMSINSSAFGDGYYLRSVNHSRTHYLYKAGRFCGTIHAVPDINDVDQELMNNYIVLR